MATKTYKYHIVLSRGRYGSEERVYPLKRSNSPLSQIKKLANKMRGYRVIPGDSYYVFGHDLDHIKSL